MDTLEDLVRRTLAGVRDPASGRKLGELAKISGLVVGKGVVGLALDAGDSASARRLEGLRAAAETAVRALPGVDAATIVLTGERAAPQGSPPQSGGLRPPPHAPGERPPPARAPSAPPLRGIAEVATIIAVASGKGGVGKSTLAVNLALALAARGKRVGLLDADIYGPSVPHLVGLAGHKPEIVDKMLQPLPAHGLLTMSIGYLVEESKAMVWRGPMVTSALTQLLGDVAWGKLDILVVDMPPGTGDAQLTMAQRVPLAGAVIVSTPQDLALADARKGIAMFGQVKVPVLGIVENMSHFLCPHCGERSDIFGHGGARATAAALGVPFLGEIPLHPQIRELSDAGTPVMVAAPESPQAAAFTAVASAVAGLLRDSP